MAGPPTWCSSQFLSHSDFNLSAEKQILSAGVLPTLQIIARVYSLGKEVELFAFIKKNVPQMEIIGSLSFLIACKNIQAYISIVCPRRGG